MCSHVIRIIARIKSVSPLLFVSSALLFGQLAKYYDISSYLLVFFILHFFKYPKSYFSFLILFFLIGYTQVQNIKKIEIESKNSYFLKVKIMKDLDIFHVRGLKYSFKVLETGESFLKNKKLLCFGSNIPGSLNDDLFEGDELDVYIQIKPKKI